MCVLYGVSCEGVIKCHLPVQGVVYFLGMECASGADLEVAMPGWGNVFGGIADFFGSKAERRRNAIAKLEARQKFIEDNKRNDLVDEYKRNESFLKRMYAEAKNA